MGALVLVAAVLLAHGAMLGRALVWDDLLILRQIELSGAWRVLDYDPFGFVRPGKTALYSALHAAFGGQAWGYGLAGLAALLAAVLLVWRLAGRLLGPAGAFAAALLFAVHPLHVEGAGWTAASNGTWMLLFALGYYLFLLGARTAASAGPSGRHTALPATLGATFCFIAALLMKEDAIVLPVTGALLLLAAGRRPERRTWLAWGAQYAFAAAFLIFTRLRSAQAGQALLPLPYAPWVITLASPRFILSECLYFVAPFYWAYYRAPRPEPAFFFPLLAAGWLAAAGLAGWLARTIRSWRVKDGAQGLVQHQPLFFVLMSVVALVPTANLLPLGNDLFGVRYLTHGGLGLALLAGWCVERANPPSVLRNSPLFRIPHAAIRFILSAWLLAAIVFSNLGHLGWKSEERFFSRAAQVNPHSAKFVQELARIEFNRGKWAEAEARCRQALERDPKHSESRIILGMALARQGHADAALAEWRAVDASDPSNTDVAIHLAEHHAELYASGRRQEDFKAAETYYRRAATALGANAETAFVNWGLLWAVNGQPAKAIPIWEGGLQRYPKSRELDVNLGIARRQISGNITAGTKR